MSSADDTTTRSDDRSTNGLLGLLDAADGVAGAAELRAHSYDLLELRPGAAVVDVGCGAGRAVAELRDRGVRAIGIDPSGEMIAVARQRWRDGDFLLGTAEELPFADGDLAGYRADKVYHVLAEPSRALAEAHRVLAAGARIVLVGQDWEALVIDSDDPALTRTIVHARAEALPSPRVARGYRNLLLDHGFTEVTVEVRTAVFTETTMLPMLSRLAEAARSADAVTGEQADAWTAEQTRRAHVDRLLLAIPLFVAAATRP